MLEFINLLLNLLNLWFGNDLNVTNLTIKFIVAWYILFSTEGEAILFLDDL